MNNNNCIKNQDYNYEKMSNNYLNINNLNYLK